VGPRGPCTDTSILMGAVALNAPTLTPYPHFRGKPRGFQNPPRKPYSPCANPSPGKGRQVVLPGKNDHEDSGSSGGGGRDFIHAPIEWPSRSPPMAAHLCQGGGRGLVCRHGVRLPWPNVNLPHGWHLNQACVLVPAIPSRSPACHCKILHQWAFLTLDLHRDLAYAVESPLGERCFKAEHDART
jgi:hypothetical protein